MRFAEPRIAELLSTLELMAAGDTGKRLPVSPSHDELDAIAYGINVLVGELAWTGARVLEAQEQRAAELRAAVARAEDANAAKNIFLRNITHEIRTPIAAMLGFTGLLAAPNLTPEDREDLVRRVQANGAAVLALLGGLLDLARLDADKIVLTPEAVPVFDLMREVLASLEIETRSKRLDVRLEVTSDALGNLRTDRHRLRQILVNLIGNAIKFTTAGSIVVSLRTAAAENGSQWIIDVADTGIGIAPDRHALLFEPFAQADASIAQTYGGSGLGLALSRRLAERMGGSLVLLRSAPGSGSTFRLTVNPIAGPVSPELESRSADALPTEGGIAGLRILLVEDHRDIQLAMRRLLQQEGAIVVSARDGHEALAKFRSAPIDVVLMDLRMPNLDGVQATRALRAQGCKVPIIALTADPTSLSRAEAVAAGCDDCLSKPFGVSDLIAVIRARLPRQVAPEMTLAQD
jgi:signal transduction histidine kinase/ActR/RegA family two-component response regulator